MMVAKAPGRGQITLSADRQAFEIRFSTYYPELVETVKAVPGRRFLPDTKKWQVPMLPPGATLVLRLAAEAGLQCAAELLAQLDPLDQLLAMDGFWHFARRYCAARRQGGVALLNSASNLAEPKAGRQ